VAIKRGLTRRLGRELMLQAVYISLAVLVGLFAALRLMEDVVIKEALLSEADYYWRQEQANPGWPLPDTMNLTGYREDRGVAVPGDLRGLETGYHRRKEPRESLTYITEQDGKRLYLVFEVAQVDELVTVFGIIPLAFTLIVIYLSLYIAYRVSRRAVSPVVSLAQQVQQLDPAAPETASIEIDKTLETDDEIRILADALQDLLDRVSQFAGRERRFTRDASHELRTPLSVIKIAVDSLLSDPDTTGYQRQTLNRIRNSARDMEQLTLAFLLLAREAAHNMECDWLSVNDIVEAELDRERIIDPHSKITTRVDADCELLVNAPAKVLDSVIGNLVRNALAYTDAGSVTIQIRTDSITIEDTGPGMVPGEADGVLQASARKQRQRGGFGVGLTIVKRLTDAFNWPVEVKSEPGAGTRVTVQFPDARIARPDEDAGLV